MKKLPDRPSELVELALRDLRQVEKNIQYIVDMGVWHAPTPRGRCKVCMAGAVMAGTLEVPVEEEMYVGHRALDADTTSKLNAIDYFRVGHLRDGLGVMGIDENPEPVRVTDYEDDREGFYRDMKRVVRALREAGL